MRQRMSAAAALDQFRAIVGDSHTLTASEATARYGACTTATDRPIAGAVRPGTVEEIQAIVKTAAACQVPLYPISTGNNWGYGAALPATNDNVIVDLGRLNRIVEVNRELAYAV